jgi:hypothetical protein
MVEEHEREKEKKAREVHPLQGCTSNDLRTHKGLIS